MKVVGTVKKGDKVYDPANGTASRDGENLVGFALESSDEVAQKNIEVMVPNYKYCKQKKNTMAIITATRYNNLRSSVDPSAWGWHR